MYLFDLFDYDLYQFNLSNGYIRENSHPYLDLRILNYTEKAQYEQIWNNVTTQCRGLIVNSEDKVIARPFDKFMNYGQNQADKLLMDYPIVATDKMDGSLGILWDYEGVQGIATRGSFTSEQAIHATLVWQAKYGFSVAPAWTYLFEIVYPTNRIVLNYGEMDELVLLGVRDIEEGSVLLPKDVVTWRGPRAATYHYKTLREALEAPPRLNAEGYVVYFPDLDYRIKIKQEDYIILHKIVTGLTKRRVWELMKEGKSFQDLCEFVPDEWHEWLNETYEEIDAAFCLESNKISLAYSAIKWSLPENFTRKEFAEKANQTEYPNFMFGILDGRDMTNKLWDLVRPSAE